MTTKYFDIEQEHILIEKGSHFFCCACLTARAVEEQSKNQNYCTGCFTPELRNHLAYQKHKKTKKEQKISMRATGKIFKKRVKKPTNGKNRSRKPPQHPTDATKSTRQPLKQKKHSGDPTKTPHETKQLELVI